MPHHSERRAVACTAIAIAALAAFVTVVAFAAEDRPAGTSAAPAAEAKNPVSPLIVSRVPQREIVPVLGTDGRYHVLYELQLTNTLSGPTHLHSVEAIDAGNDKTLLRLGPEDIRKGEYLHTLDRKTAETNSFGPFEGRVIILNLSFDAKVDIPRKVIYQLRGFRRGAVQRARRRRSRCSPLARADTRTRTCMSGAPTRLTES